jgi:hypothetical protein
MRAANVVIHPRKKMHIQGVIEIHGIILTTSYWLHVELGKKI